MDKIEKMVEIARFTYPAEAQTLVMLLKSEGIECYVRNEISSQIMAGYVDIGGARVELLEGDVPQALEIMKDNGYEIPNENELPGTLKSVSRVTGRIPFLKKFPLEKQILYFLILIALLLVGLIYTNLILFPN